MFRRKKKKRDTEQALAAFSRERIEHGDGHGPSPNGHVTGEPDEEQDDHEFNVELHSVSDEPRPATEDDAADRVNAIWRQRVANDPEGALDDVRGRVKGLGYELACAGRTFMEPLTKRTYYIMNPDERVPLDVFHNGDVDLTLLEVCVWSEMAFKRWKYSADDTENHQ
jgi:hypothetical protein